MLYFYVEVYPLEAYPHNDPPWPCRPRADQGLVDVKICTAGLANIAYKNKMCTLTCIYVLNVTVGVPPQNSVPPQKYICLVGEKGQSGSDIY